LAIGSWHSDFKSRAKATGIDFNHVMVNIYKVVLTRVMRGLTAYSPIRRRYYPRELVLAARAEHREPAPGGELPGTGSLAD
jgi:hypothetical protein